MFIQRHFCLLLLSHLRFIYASNKDRLFFQALPSWNKMVTQGSLTKLRSSPIYTGFYIIWLIYICLPRASITELVCLVYLKLSTFYWTNISTIDHNGNQKHYEYIKRKHNICPECLNRRPRVVNQSIYFIRSISCHWSWVRDENWS